jgi:NitT/TauT family transport system permease protein
LVAAIEVFSIPAFVVPPPADVIQSLFNLPGYYAHHFSVTAMESAAGALIGFTIGVIAGMLVRYGGPVGRALNPLLLASQVFPKEALAPVFLVFLGFGVTHKIVISALICFFPVVVSTSTGLSAVPTNYNRLMSVLGATPWHRFWRCHLPFAAPYILSSLRVCATLSVIGAVVGEFVGSSDGLGHVIRGASGDIGIDRVYAALLLLGVLGAVFYGIAALIERVVFGRYTRAY